MKRHTAISSQRSASPRGFTLVEILLGISIFSLIALTVFNVLNNGIRISRQSGGADDTDRQFLFMFELLERELQNIVPYDFSGISETQRAFVGDSASMMFITITGGELKAVRYFLEDAPAGTQHQEIIGKVHSGNVSVTESSSALLMTKNLIREEMPMAEFLADDFVFNESHSRAQILASSVEPAGFKIEYGSENREGGLSFGIYPPEKEIPQIVRVSLKIRTADQNAGAVELSRKILIPIGFIEKEGEDAAP